MCVCVCVRLGMSTRACVYLEDLETNLSKCKPPHELDPAFLFVKQQQRWVAPAQGVPMHDREIRYVCL